MYKTDLIFSILKNAHSLQRLFIKCVARTPWIVDFTLEKIAAFKKIFNFVNVENVAGDYVEFGVFEGTSFITAFECHICTKQTVNPQRKFWGFDSFEGLRFGDSDEQHASFQNGDFKADYEMVESRLRRSFKKRAPWELVKGYLEDTVSNTTAPELGIETVSVVLFDLDLGPATKLALDFVKPALQQGSVLICDEYFWYRGDTAKGEAAAFAMFQEENPQFEFRNFMNYGVGARVFVLSAITDAGS